MLQGVLILIFRGNTLIFRKTEDYFRTISALRNHLQFPVPSCTAFVENVECVLPIDLGGDFM